MTNKNNHSVKFVSALKEAVRAYPDYFCLTGSLDELDAMWDMQPKYGNLEKLLLEDDITQQFIAAVWSFFQPLALLPASFACSTRKLHGWQREILAQMMINDPLNNHQNQPNTTDALPL